MEAPLTTGTALYLYGIVETSALVPSCDAVEEGTATGVIAGDRVACVVSRVTARDYESSGGNAAEQLAWVTPRAWRHHDVVRRLHMTTTVIPLKFGTLCGSAADVSDLLRRCAGPIGALLERFHGRDEWTLSIRLDNDRVIKRFEQDDRELRAWCADEQALPEGRAYFARKKRQQRAEALLAAELDTATRAVHARIAAYVDDWYGDHTLLVDRACFVELTACLAELEAEHAMNALALELRGPWAPYSFVNETIDCRELAPASGTDSRTAAGQQRQP